MILYLNIVNQSKVLCESKKLKLKPIWNTNKGYIEHNNPKVVEKYTYIKYSLNDDKLILSTVFIGGIVKYDTFASGIWNKYIGTKYKSPMYAHEDDTIEIECNINETIKIKCFIEDIIKYYISKGW
jgi:hypothetical protein